MLSLLILRDDLIEEILAARFESAQVHIHYSLSLTDASRPNRCKILIFPGVDSWLITTLSGGFDLKLRT